MSTIDHDEAQELLAVYALGALVTEEERVALDRHLDRCAACRADLDGYREVAAGLSAEVAPSAELWVRLRDEIQPRAVPIGSRRPARPNRGWMGAAAAVTALVLGVGVGQVTSDGPDPTPREVAAEAREDAGTTVLMLVSAGGEPAAEAVVTADGRGYLDNRDLPALGGDRGYQLWALRDGQPVSIALLGNAPDVEAFRAPERFDQLLITEEPAIGSPSPTAAPVASATA